MDDWTELRQLLNDVDGVKPEDGANTEAHEEADDMWARLQCAQPPESPEYSVALFAVFGIIWDCAQR